MTYVWQVTERDRESPFYVGWTNAAVVMMVVSRGGIDPPPLARLDPSLARYTATVSALWHTLSIVHYRPLRRWRR